MIKQLRMKSLLLLCALIVGSLGAWAQSNFSAIYTSGVTLTTTGGTSASACKVVIGGTQYDGLKAGTGKIAGALKITVPSGAKYLHIHVAGWNGESVSLSVTPNTNISPLSIPLTANSGINSNTPFTLSGDVSSSSYYKVITFSSVLNEETTLSFEATSGKRFVIWGVNAEAVPSSVIIKNGGAAASNLAMTVGDDDVTLTASVLPALASQTVTWSSDDEAVATVSNGVVRAVAAGNTVIRATSTVNTVYAECNLTVSAATSPSATVSETALAFGDIEVGQSKDLTFTVTPANLTGNLTIACDNDKYTVSPTSIDQSTTTPQTITVTAAPTALNDNMDATITISGGGIVSKDVVLTAIPYQVATVTLSATNGSIKEGDDEKTSLTSRVGSSATLTAVPASGYIFDGWTAVGATPTSSDDIETEFTFASTDVTITANFIVNPYRYATLEGTDMAAMDNAGTGYGTVKSITKDGLVWSTDGYQTTDNGVANKIIQLKTVSSGSPYIQLPEFPGYIQTITFSVTNASNSATSKGSTTTNAQFSFRTTATGSDVLKTKNGATNEIVIDLSKELTTYNTGYIVSSAGARIWDITVAYIPTATVTLASACKDGEKFYGTYSNSSAFVVPADLTVSAISVAGDKLTVTAYETGDVVKANTGVMVSSTSAGDHTIVLSNETGSEISGNMLKASGDAGIDAATMNEANKLFYRLTMHNGTDLGFYWGAANGAAFDIAANKAYLAVPVGGEARIAGFSLFDDEGEATAIEGVKTIGTDAPVFNLNGQRVNSNAKGLLIKNGKKFMNR